MGELDKLLRDAVEQHGAVNLIHNGHESARGRTSHRASCRARRR